VRLDLNGHLVGGSTHTTRTNLEGWTHVIEGFLQHHNGLLTALLGHTFEGTVNDALCKTLLTGYQDLVHQLRNNGGPVYGVGYDGALRGWAFTRHYFFSIFAP
jgi:hypothetical protein